MKYFIKILIFVSYLQATAGKSHAEYAEHLQALQSARSILDPIVLALPNIEGSMIGGCIEGSDLDPFFELTEEERGLFVVKACLVYFSKDKSAKKRIWIELAKRGIKISAQVRTQAPFGKMIEQCP